MRSHLLKLPVLALALFTASGCASSILIQTDPPGAQVIVDGQYLGRSPVRYTDVAPIGTGHRVELRLEGHESKVVSFYRNGPVNVGAVCGGLLFLFPFIWVQDYPPYATYLLDPMREAPRWQSPPAALPPEEDEAPWPEPPPPPPESERRPPAA